MSSNSSEIDLETADPSLIDLISSFVDSRESADASTSYQPITLGGFTDVELRGRFEHQADSRLLVWVVTAVLFDRRDLGPVALRYAMTADELGDVWTDRARCELRLSTYAEAHLRADLHLIRQGYVPVAVSGVTRIDRRGWAEEA